MKVEKIKHNLEIELAREMRHLEAAKEDLANITARVQVLQENVSRLQNALNALNNGQPILVHPTTMRTEMLSPSKVISGNEIEIKGEKYIVEPGFEVVTNSKGEPAIVPIGQKPMEVEIPEISQEDRKATTVAGSAEFDDPKDMF